MKRNTLIEVILEGNFADMVIATAFDPFLVFVGEENAARKLAKKLMEDSTGSFTLCDSLFTFGAELFVPNERTFGRAFAARKVHTLGSKLPAFNALEQIFLQKSCLNLLLQTIDSAPRTDCGEVSLFV